MNRIDASLPQKKLDFPGWGGGVHNMLRARVCAAHMGGFLGLKFSKKGSLFGRFSLIKGGLSRNWQKLQKIGGFLPKFIIKVGMTARFGN